MKHIMHDHIDNPLLPTRMETLTFWGLVISIFLGWSLFCTVLGYLAAAGG